MKYNLVVFDLDGTLLNTSKGIFNSVRYAEKKMHLSPIRDEQLSLFVGPPPASMYKVLYGLDDSDALKAAGYHREYARIQGLYEAEIYDGILETLDSLRINGVKLAVATLKSQEIAEKILDHFQISQYFDVIVGMNKEESLSKADTIRIAMNTTNVVEKVILVGDSKYDLEGAEQVGIDFLGVLYGFGFQNKEDIMPWPSVKSFKEIDFS